MAVICSARLQVSGLALFAICGRSNKCRSVCEKLIVSEREGDKMESESLMTLD